jgi:hypothetical protein
VKKSIRIAAAASVVAAAAVASVGVGQAHAVTLQTCTTFADPSSTKTFNVVGSNTFQDAYGGLTQGYMWNGNTYTATTTGGSIGSWNAINPAGPLPCQSFYDTITPVTGGTGDSFTRPNGSGDGRIAVSAAWNSAKHSWTDAGGNTNTLTKADAIKQQELTFARSSSLPGQANWVNAANPTVTDQLTFIPQAIDAVGVAEVTIGSGTAVSNFASGALVAIYNAGTFGTGTNVGDVVEVSGKPFIVTVRGGGTGKQEQVVPTVPQAGSGTRGFWLTAVGSGSTPNAVVSNETQEENKPANDLNTTNIQAGLSYTLPTDGIAIAPLSGGAAISQLHGLAPNQLGATNIVNSPWPTVDNDTLFTGSGVSATVGTLQSAQSPQITFGASLTGNFDRYLFAAVPSSLVVTGNPSGESALQKWIDQDAPDAAPTGGTSTSVWSDFGFKPIGHAVSDNSSNWIHTKFLN